MPKTAFITGATSGFGRACALRLGQAGWNLILTGRRQERLDALQEELGSQCQVLTRTLDVRDAAAVKACVDNLPAPFDQIDLLLNNAGLALGTEPAQECDPDAWKQMIDTNILGLTTVTHALLPKLIAKGARRQHHQSGLHRRSLALPGWQRLLRHQGFCGAVLLCPAL